MSEEIMKLHAEVRLNRLESITKRKETDAESLMNTICAQNELGETVFHVGARYGRTEVVELALGLFNDSAEKGYVLKVANRRGLLAMHEAILSGETSTARLLLFHHPMPKTEDPQSSQVRVPAQESSYEITEGIVEKRTSNDLKDFKDAFFYALTADDIVIIKELLVRCGAGFVGEIFRKSPLEICASRGSWKSFGLLLDNKVVIKPNTDGTNLLHTAILNGRWPEKWCGEAGEALLNEPDLVGNTPLHYAVRRKDVAATQWLIAHGANIHARNVEGKKALDVAEECNFSNEVWKILKGKKARAGLKGKKKLQKERTDEDKRLEEEKRKRELEEEEMKSREERRQLKVKEELREWAVQVDREETRVPPAVDRKTQLSQAYANLLPWLIAACFTSVLTVPGAFNGLGLPNMLHEPSFRAFLICIATAMGAGLVSAICMVSGRDLRVCGRTYRVERLGFLIVRIAYMAFLGAFCLVVSMMSVPRWVLIYTFVICCLSFFFDIGLFCFGVDRNV